MNQSAEKTNMRKKKAAGISALLLALLLLIGGTFAWYTFASELNEFEHEPYGALLHDDYKEARGDNQVSNKDVYVENTGEVDLSVRVQLKEYMEIEETSLIADKKKETRESWTIHRHNPDASIPAVEDCEEVFHDYWSWKMGGESIEYEKGKLFQTGTKCRYDEEGNDTLQNAVNTGYTNGGRASEVITIEEYMADYFYQEIPFEGWILDSADGYAYWSDYLEPGEATGLLLDEVVLKDKINNRYYYGIDVVMEAVDDTDMLAWLEPDTPTTAGKETEEASEEAKKFLRRRYYGALDSIAVKDKPKKMEYLHGESFEPKGMILMLTYETGVIEELLYSADSGITWGPDTKLGTPETDAEQEYIPITIWYEGKETTLDVTVNNPVETVTINGTPSTKTYVTGNPLSTEGLTVTAKRMSEYLDLDEAKADTEGISWNLPTLTNTGQSTLTNQSANVTATYGGKTSAVKIFTGITITNPLESITATSSTSIYYEGEKFDSTKMTVTGHYASQNSYKLTTGWSCTPTGVLSTVGLQEITVSYTGVSPPITTEVMITVKSWKEAINDKDEFEDVIIKDNTWIILNKDKGQAELLSKDCVGAQQWHISSTEVSWSGSWLRWYLNGTTTSGYLYSLPTELKNSIVTQTNYTNYWGDPTDIKKDETKDNVYLLDYEDYVDYDTKFKKEKGWSLGTYGVSTNYDKWWLRMPSGGTEYVAVYVYRSDGDVHWHDVINKSGVRPALTVKYK